MVASAIAKKAPYATTYRLIRGQLEKNVQEHRDSDAFLLGAHLIAAVWADGLPHDVTWRTQVLARHRDIVGWLVPKVGLPLADVAHLVVQVQQNPGASEERLHDFLRQITERPDSEPVRTPVPPPASAPHSDPRSPAESR